MVITSVNSGGVQVDGTVKGNTVEFACSFKENDQTKPLGKLTGIVAGDQMQGSGNSTRSR